jgi:hypothetical protein
MHGTRTRAVISVAALSGALTFGVAGMAGATTAAPATTPTTHTIDCTKALARVPKINAREAKAATWVTKAQAREATATSAGHTKLANRIERRITRVQKAEARGTKVLAKISAACGTGS